MAIRGCPLTERARPQRKTIPDREESDDFKGVLLRAFQLGQPYRDLFLLREIQGHTLAETARIMGVSPGIAVTRLKEARRKFRRFKSVEAAMGTR